MLASFLVLLFRVVTKTVRDLLRADKPFYALYLCTKSLLDSVLLFCTKQLKAKYLLKKNKERAYKIMKKHHERCYVNILVEDIPEHLRDKVIEVQKNLIAKRNPVQGF